jgi:predicted adenylyl cyclase CyaB
MMFLPRRNLAKAILSAALEPLAIVDKRREIYFVGNVKIHLDHVRGLGKFVEVEAIRKLTADGRKSKVREEMIREQARKFQKLFAIQDRDLMARSYSDLILKN